MRRRNLEVPGAFIALDQEAVVFGIEDGLLVVLAGERLHSVKRAPEGEHDELAAAAELAAEHEDAAIAVGFGVVANTRLLHVRGVGISVLGANRASPGSSDHRDLLERPARSATPSIFARVPHTAIEHQRPDAFREWS